VLTRARTIAACAGALAVALSLVTATSATGAPALGDRKAYLRLAAEGIDRAKEVWWNPAAHWYTESPHTPSDGPRDVATLWQLFPLFEAIDLVAIASPSRANRAAVSAFARGAERYWDPGLKPIGGYWFLPFNRRNVNAFFDDNGWWGLAFFDAYTATHNRRFLADAIRAFRFIQRAGWARNEGGGIWWDTAHDKKTSEPLAAQILLGAELYGVTHVRGYLNESLKLLRWADQNSWNAQRGLYQRNETDATVMNYVEGMMISAHVELCRATARTWYCERAQKLAEGSLKEFPILADWAPETDVVYLRGLLDLYVYDRDPRWYAVVYANAARARELARDDAGLWSKRWDGGWTLPGALYTQAATLQLFAWLAAAAAPSA
jgi:hypothetical protein